MYARITNYRVDTSKRTQALQWIDSITPRIKSMNAQQVHFIEKSPEEWMTIALYASKEDADRMSENSTQNFKEAVEKGFVIAASVQRSEGEVIRTI